MLVPQQMELFLAVTVGAVAGCRSAGGGTMPSPGLPGAGCSQSIRNRMSWCLHPCRAMHCKVWLCFRVSQWSEVGKGQKYCWEGERHLEWVCFGTKEVERTESNILRSCQIWQYID